jgi:hypothetical protein
MDGGCRDAWMPVVTGDPAGKGGIHRRLSDLFGAIPKSSCPAADAAAAVARHRLSRLAVRAAAAELLFARRFLRPDRLRIHASTYGELFSRPISTSSSAP